MKTIKKNKKQNEVQRWAPSIARWRVRRWIDGLRVPPHGCRLAFRWWPWRATNQGAALVRPATNQRVAIREIAHRRLFPRAVINLQSVRIVKKKKGKMAKKKKSTNKIKRKKMKTNEKAVLILSIFCWLNQTCTEFFTFFFDGQGCSLLFFFPLFPSNWSFLLGFT